MDNVKLKLRSQCPVWPTNVIVACPGQPDEIKTINSKEEMNLLLEEVKLFNSENEIKKRIISI